MNKAFEQFGFSIELTEDGSPTLRLSHQGESMHHSAGAATETIYIYGDVIEKAQQIIKESGLSCKTCIVGLGLGYIEIAWAIASLKNNIEASEKNSFQSFEIVPELINHFKNWVYSSESNELYDLIVDKFNSDFSIAEIKKTLQVALKTGSQIDSDITQHLIENQNWNIICYDAFSKKTNHELWSFDFLKQFIKNQSQENCVFSTYACTRDLKQALTENQFEFYKRRGFSDKRNSALALRGVFNSQHFFQTF